MSLRDDDDQDQKAILSQATFMPDIFTRGIRFSGSDLCCKVAKKNAEGLALWREANVYPIGTAGFKHKRE